MFRRHNEIKSEERERQRMNGVVKRKAGLTEQDARVRFRGRYNNDALTLLGSQYVVWARGKIAALGSRSRRSSQVFSLVIYCQVRG